MGPFSLVYLHWRSYLRILIYFMLAFLPSAWIIFSHQKQYVVDNWPNLKCKPYAAPFAGFVRNERGFKIFEDGLKNVFGCLWSQIKSFFAILMKPFRFIIDIIHSILKAMVGTMDIFRQQIAVIRKFLQTIIQSVMGRLENLAATFVNIFYRLRDMMSRSFATFKMITYILETMALTMKSMMGGPVGTMMRFSGNIGYVATYFVLGPNSFLYWPELWHCVFCFAPNTPIVMADGTIRQISMLRIGDRLKNSSVTGVLKFCPVQVCPVYRRGDDIVTSTHQVWSGTDWIFVRDHPDYHPVDYQGPLYCLATDTHRIHTPSATYLDWEETSNPQEWGSQKLGALHALHPNSYQPHLDSNHLYQEGFVGVDETILRNNNSIHGEGTWASSSDVIWYRPTKSVKSYQVTGSTLVKHDTGWHQVCDDTRFEVIDIKYQPATIKHYQSDTGYIRIGELMFRDLMEHPDPNYYYTKIKDRS